MNKVTPIVAYTIDNVYGKIDKNGKFRRSSGNVLNKKTRFHNRKSENRK